MQVRLWGGVSPDKNHDTGFACYIPTKGIDPFPAFMKNADQWQLRFVTFLGTHGEVIEGFAKVATVHRSIARAINQ